MLTNGIAPGVTMKFPLSVRMNGMKRLDEDCVQAGPLALTLVKGNDIKAIKIDFVPFVAGAVNYAHTDGDAISGVFSGCVMSVYNTDGERRVAHVSTAETPDLDCKALMRSLMDNPEYNAVLHFKPYDKGRDGKITDKIGLPLATFGVITGTNHSYSVYTRRVTEYEYVVVAVEDRDKNPYVFA